MSRRSLRTLTVAAAFAPLALACGGSGDGSSDSGTTPGPTTQGDCQLTVSGATSGAGACLAGLPKFEYDAADGVTSVALSGGKQGQAALVIARLRGRPSATTYPSKDPLLASWSVVLTEGPSLKTWAATSPGSTQSEPVGDWALTFTSVGTPVTKDGVESYPAHGTLQASLLPMPGTGSSGTVKVDIAF